MFKIIGGDGRPYGPVSADQIRQWIAEGRATAQTMAQLEGSVEWKPLGQYPEFAVSATPPVMPATPPVPVSVHAVRPEQNKMATAGFVMGIISVTIGLLCCGPLFGILGIIFSSVGLSQIGHDPAERTGRSLAVWGLVLSIIGLLAGIGLAVLFGLGRALGHRSFYWHYRYPY